MPTELPKRKNTRLPQYDYSQAGYYFVTICTKEREHAFRRGAQCAPEKEILPPLTEIGRAAEALLLEIPNHYNNVAVDKYLVMPNHIHAVLIISGCCGRTLCAPTLSRIVKAYREAVTKKTGTAIWQKGYYDHIIRNEQDYQRIWRYIDDNPVKWSEDEYYTK